MNDMTPKQRERQQARYRNRGRYAQVNPCYGCGKSAGVDYFSHPLTDIKWGDLALQLCERCYRATEHMTDEAEFIAYAEKHGGA